LPQHLREGRPGRANTYEGRIRREVMVDQDLSGLVEDADVEGSGMEIDPAVVAVLRRVESHEAPSSRLGWTPPTKQ